ncbi:MAG: hypothetical protein AAGE59_27430 [Cyanobacteria bacterium P01_F01_bin.86]
MVVSRFWSTAIASVSLLFWNHPVQAEAPGIYYAWRSIDADITGCIDRATVALDTQELANIQIEVNSISGTTENATALFVCFENAGSTTVMIMVSSTDDDTAFELRELLKDIF